MVKKKKKENPILSEEQKDAKEAIKKKRREERKRRKKEKRVSNWRKRAEEALEDDDAFTKESNESPTSKKAARKKRKKEEKLEKLRKPLILTKKELRKVDRLKSSNTIAWWDFENLPYPKVGAYGLILNKLRREGYTGELDLHATVGYKGDTQPIEDNTFTMHYGSLKPRPPETKDNQKADRRIKFLIDKFLEEKRDPQNTFFITNDNGFRKKMDLLREAGNSVLLATMQDSLIIKAGSHKVWRWKNDFVPED